MYDDSCGVPFTQNTPEQNENAKREIMIRQYNFVAVHFNEANPGGLRPIDDVATSSLLYILSGAIKQNLSLLPELSSYLSKALINITSGADIKEAFGYTSKHGQVKVINSAIRYALGMQVEQKLILKKMTKKKARKLVGDEYYLGVEAIEKYHLAYLKDKSE